MAFLSFLPFLPFLPFLALLALLLFPPLFQAVVLLGWPPLREENSHRPLRPFPAVLGKVVDKVVAALVQAVVGQVRRHVVQVIFGRRRVLVHADSHQAVPAQEGLERLELGDEHIDAQVELAAAQQHRMLQVALDDDRLVGAHRPLPRHEILHGAAQEDAVALTPVVRLDDVGVGFAGLVARLLLAALLGTGRLLFVPLHGLGQERLVFR